jgi:4'-phosphopantetheinyl transferase
VAPTSDDERGGGAIPAATDRGWALPAEELHVWHASLERPPQTAQRMAQLLAPEERRRADAYRFERHRSRFIVARALLRILLAGYTQAAPDELRLHYGEFDKPLLIDGPWFNLSHSGNVALYAFSSVGEVGVDVELFDEGVTGEGVAERFFSTAEVDALRSLPAHLRPRAFLTCWTRKEAFIKARGDGLNLPLDSFDVTLAPDAPAALVRTAWSNDEPQHWQLEDLSDREAGYVAAVAIQAYESKVLKRYFVDTVETIEGCMPRLE